MSDRSREETTQTMPSEGLAMVAERVSWLSLVNDVGADVAVVDTDGRLRYVSPSPRHWRFVARMDGHLAGRSLFDVFARELAEERLGAVRRASLEHQPFVMIEVWRGVRTRVTYRPMPHEAIPHHGHAPSHGHASHTPGLVLVVCRPVQDGSHDDDSDAEAHVHARFNDWGTLATLTARELDVLALIGRGLTTAQIAQTLSRSNKTVEAHRLSLGLKLKASNRVQLARIALRAGLTRRRIEVPAVRANGVSQPVSDAAAFAEEH